MQGTRVPCLVWEDSTCLEATKPLCHNYWPHVLQLLRPMSPRACAPQQEKPLQWEACAAQLESSPHSLSSVQFSRSVMSHCLQPHGLQHTRPPCLSPTPGVHPNSCLSSRWCHLTISSSVIPFSSRLQSCPESGSFQMSQLFTSDGQSIGASASTSVLPVNTQDWSPLGWTGWISLQSRGLPRVFFNTTVQKHQFYGAKPSL